MRSILTFVAVVSFIAFMHATNLRLPNTPTSIGTIADAAKDLTIPGSTAQLPVPEATEALVYLPDSLFQSYRGDHNLFVTNHYHVLYVKTDTLYMTSPSPVATSRIYAGNMIYR